MEPTEQACDKCGFVSATPLQRVEVIRKVADDWLVSAILATLAAAGAAGVTRQWGEIPLMAYIAAAFSVFCSAGLFKVIVGPKGLKTREALKRAKIAILVIASTLALGILSVVYWGELGGVFVGVAGATACLTFLVCKSELLRVSHEGWCEQCVTENATLLAVHWE